MQSHDSADMDGGGFIVKCRDCTYSKNFGASRGNAARAGTRHANSRPTHRVRLLKVIHEWRAIDSMDELKAPPEPPPF